MPAQFRMNLGLTPPAIELIGSDGVTRFDSRDKLFRCTDVLKGTLELPFRSTPLNVVNSYAIGICAADADFVLGYMRTTSVTFSGAPLNPFPDTGEWFYMSGSFVGFPNPGANNYGGSDCCVYTFLASGGAVTLEEQLAIYELKNQFGQTFAYAGFTLEYELWIGTFL